MADKAFAAYAPKQKGFQLPPVPPVDPSTHLPPTFRIGTKYATPFVSIPNVVDHLTFLSCLHRLQEDVRYAGGDEPEDTEIELSPEVRWAAFCTRAGVRFDEWASSPALLNMTDMLFAQGGEVFDEAMVDSIIAGVDIDVLMAWHSYFLNPRAYEEDMMREGGRFGYLRGINALGPFPLNLIVSAGRVEPNVQVKNIDPQTFVYQRRQNVNDALPPSAFASHPIPLVSLHPLKTMVPVTCISCKTKFNVPLIGPPAPVEGGGYMSSQMDIGCPHCFFRVTHAKLRFARMVRNLADVQSGRIQYLAGFGPSHTTIGTSDLSLNLAGSIAFSQMLVQACMAGLYRQKGPESIIDPMEVGTACDWSMDSARTNIVQFAVNLKLVWLVCKEQVLGNGSVKHYRLVFASALRRWYRVNGEGSGGLASLDLGAAIMRQAAFVGSMENIGWLATERWRQPDDPHRYYLLQKAAARYRTWALLYH